MAKQHLHRTRKHCRVYCREPRITEADNERDKALRRAAGYERGVMRGQRLIEPMHHNSHRHQGYGPRGGA